MVLHRYSSRAGSTLLIALWALLLLSAVVFGWAKWIDRRLEMHREEALGLEARSLALSGLALAYHPQILPGSPLLHATMESERSFDVTLTSEGGKLNLLYLLRDENPIRRELLNNYLTAHGLSLEEREAFVDGILDWMDADSLVRNRGAEESGDYKPTNRPLASLDELPLIHGTAPLIERHPGWREDFTLHSTGSLDWGKAPAHLLELIPGVQREAAEAFVTYRKGADGIEGSADDPVITTMSEISSRLGLSNDQVNAVGAIAGFNDPTWQVRSVGRAGDVSRQITAIMRRTREGATPIILLQTEP